jgi:hypothetical protein
MIGAPTMVHSYPLWLLGYRQMLTLNPTLNLHSDGSYQPLLSIPGEIGDGVFVLRDWVHNVSSAKPVTLLKTQSAMYGHSTKVFDWQQKL